MFIGLTAWLGCRKLEAEADEKLQNVYQQLLQAGVDRNENERETKLRETLASLQELFPGEYPRKFF
jgi:structural maintenance of chromosome 1